MIFNQGLYYDLSDVEYHAQQDSSEHYYSSTQLKDMVTDPELFYRKYITKEIEKDSMAAFDVGSYYHCAILEPEKLDTAFAVFSGKVRRGKEWEDFQLANAGKTILTQTMKEEADNLITATKQSPIAMRILSNGTAEVSLFTELDGVKIKTRYDYLVLGKEYSYIADLKSTSGSVRSHHTIQGKIATLQYELSAALYIKAINKYITDNKLEYAPIEDFFLIFASKNQMSCKTYLLSSEQIKIGNAKIDLALKELKKYIANEWAFDDVIDIAYPPQYEIDNWLKVRKIELVPAIVSTAADPTSYL